MKEQINTILRAVGLKAEELKLEQVTVDEGAATLEAEVFEAGQPVFIVNEDERIPLPVGEYLLDDGRTLVIAEEGMIAEVKEAGAEEEEEMPEEEGVAMDNKPTEAPLPKSIIESVVKETKFSADEELINSLREEVTELKAQLKELTQPKVEETQEVKEEVELSTEEPKPIQHNPESEERKIEQVKLQKHRAPSTIDSVFRYINKK